jgi:hypothetical protein
MKKILATALISLSHFAGFAQSKFAAIWQGSLSAGRELRIVFHIKEDKGKLSATMDSPDQGVKDIACSDVIVKGDSVIILLDKFKSKYAGKMMSPNSIDGRWTQNGASFMLNMKKVDKLDELKRPQTPLPPFTYKSEDIIYKNEDKSIQYGATITIPNGEGPFPAIIMSTGSGQQNRDEEIFGHKPFAVIADYLTKKGYIVLRVDDQGIGKTTGNVAFSTTNDFVKDILVGINYLKGRKEVDKSKIGIMGHSEGGLIAPMAAAGNKDINFIVMLAGPGIDNVSLMEEQNAAVLRSYGMKKEYIDAYLPLYSEIAMTIANAKTEKEAFDMISTSVNNWKNKTDPKIVSSTTGITDEASKRKFINEFASLYEAPWWRVFMGLNVQDYLKKLDCKVLALNGEKDIQVVSQSNLAGIRETLSKSRSPKYDVQEMPGLNHLFQKCKTCTAEEYGAIDETFSPDALKVIGDWLDVNVK